MERIQRALEISRLHRAALVETRDAAAASQGDRVLRPETSAGLTDSGREMQRLTIDREALRRRRVVLGDESGPATHAYRMLRAQVLQRARSSRMRVFGIVSAAMGEGKTLTAVNLALSLAAEPNQNVTLLDLDLRRPAVAQTLGIAAECGVETWLQGSAPLASVLYELDGFPRLRVVPTLAPLAGSSEALAGSRARELLEAVRSPDSGSLTIVDLPPALLSDDVLTVAPLIDGFIFVVTERQTLRDDVERVLELLGRNRVVGTVLNGSSASEQRAY